MKKIFVTLLILPLLLIANEESIQEIDNTILAKTAEAPDEKGASLVNLEGEPSAFVFGCVNAITGQISECTTDLVSYGVEPITISRSFCGNPNVEGTFFYGWSINYSSHLSGEQERSDEPDKKYENIINLWGEFGQKIEYSSHYGKYENKPIRFSIRKNCIEEGITNTSNHFVSGQTNLKNSNILRLGDSTYQITYGDGSKKTYLKHSGDKKGRYRLSLETKPNGNSISHDFHKDIHKLLPLPQKIEVSNSLGECLNFLEFDVFSYSDFKKSQTIKFKTQSNTEVEYGFVRWRGVLPDGEDMYLVNRVTSSDKPEVKYSYDFVSSEGWKDKKHSAMCHRLVLARRSLPQNRYVAFEHYDYKTNHLPNEEIKLVKLGDPRIDRVKYIFAPSGADSNPVKVHQLVYDLNIQYDKHGNVEKYLQGSTKVYDYYKNYVVYGFNEQHRLIYIEKPDSKNNIKILEKFYWGDNDSNESTYLITRCIQSNDDLVMARHYTYDNKGNILTDTLYGDLTGKNTTSPEVDSKGNPKSNGCENFVKHCSYSENKYNLLIKESNGSHEIQYSYYPKSNLLKAKYQGVPGKWMQRTFYTYDANAALASEIVDDGFHDDEFDLAGVTERKITYYRNRTTYPVGLPEEIEERCLDLETGEELLIRRIVNAYNIRAKVTKQDYYDKNNEYSHTLSWTYDKMGNVLSKTDALGQITNYKYDANCNCIREQGPNLNVYKEFTYDFMNRLIKEEEIHADGTRLAKTHRYDPMGNKLATVDHYGNETTFKHDAFGRVIKIISPPVLDGTGNVVRPTKQRTYDAFGNVTSETDAYGSTTYYTYNIRGQIVSVTKPDGTKETNTYSLNGYLEESQATNGMITRYTNDFLGRAIKIEKLTAKGKLLTASSAVYTGFHMIEETDGNRNVTKYSYYPDGKLKSKQKGKSFILYTYDSMGREAATYDYSNEERTDAIVNRKSYDLLDRIIEETVEDLHGNLLSKVEFSYDSSGNVIEKKSAIDNKTDAYVITEYDSHNTPIVITDAEGNKTFTYIRYDYVNELNQYVPYREIIDALGNVQIFISDAIGRDVCVMRKNSLGDVLQKEEKTYDKVGNLCQIAETIYHPKNDDTIRYTRMEYDTCNRLVACIEAADSPEQQVVRTIYNQSGQKFKIIKHDGIVIQHSYDNLGRLLTISSSDNSVSYRYTYDGNGNPTLAEDLILNRNTIRVYDENDKLVYEKLAHGFIIQYMNDSIGRPVNVQLHNGTSFTYNYEGCFLKEIRRFDSKAKLKYFHRYEKHNLAGNILNTTLPGKAGKISFSYDLLGRPLSLDAPNWHDDKIVYDAVGNLLSQSIKDKLGKREQEFTYDDLYQLTSESGGVSHTYGYDSHYNRISKDGQTYTNNILDQVLDDGIHSYEYDLNGNRTKKSDGKSVIQYKYDAFDRLIAVERADRKTVYTYDESNRRLSNESLIINKNGGWNSVGIILYLYQGQNEIGACDKAGNIHELRLLGNGRGAEIGAAVALEIEDQVYVPVHDLNGNVVSIIDAKNGKTEETYRYSSYGEQLFEEAKTPWRYASKRYDEETGFIYFGRRYYDPEIGRWVTPDPIGREGGPNLYAYVNNGPLTRLDEYGLFTIDFGWDDVVYAFKTLLNVGVGILTGTDILSGFIRAEFPIPLARDVPAATMHFARNGTLEGYELELTREKTEHHVFRGKNLNPKHLVGFVPGIENDKNSSEYIAMLISVAFGDIDVTYLNNVTHGGIWDVIETCLMKVGVSTTSELASVEMVRDMLRQVGPDGEITLIAHSMGGQIVDGLRKHLSPEELMQINVVTLGSAKMIENGVFRTVINYICKNDFVPSIADPIGKTKGRMGNNINLELLYSEDDPFTAHCMVSYAYKKVINLQGSIYKQNHSAQGSF